MTKKPTGRPVIKRDPESKFFVDERLLEMLNEDEGVDITHDGHQARGVYVAETTVKTVCSCGKDVGNRYGYHCLDALNADAAAPFDEAYMLQPGMYGPGRPGDLTPPKE